MSSIPLDDHCQSVTARLRRAANQTRNIDELIGICRGVAFDNHVNQSEAESLAQWLYSQPALLSIWPANVLYERLRDVLSDGVVDKKEAAELLQLLKQVLGDKPNLSESFDDKTGEVAYETASTALPVTEPDTIVFESRSFVLTGKFASGTRAECELEVTRRGGVCQKKPNQMTDYVVVGEVGSRDWVHSSWGRKIEKAVAMQEEGYNIQVISESHWVKFLG